MKFELTLDQLEEMALCISDNELSAELALKYVKEFAIECMNDNTEDKLENIGE